MESIGQLIGPGGLNLTPSDPSQSPWLENMEMDLDGTWRPRYGLKFVRQITGYIQMMQPMYLLVSNGDFNIAMATVEGGTHKFYNGLVYETTPGASIEDCVGSSLEAVIAGSNITGISPAVSCIGVNNPNTNPYSRLFWNYPSARPGYNSNIAWNGGAGGGVPALTAHTAGGFLNGTVWNHGYHAMGVDVVQNYIKWFNYADSYNSAATGYKVIPGAYGTGIRGAQLSQNTSYVFCTGGVLQLTGELNTKFRWSETALSPAVGPHGCVARGANKIFYLSPGPRLSIIGGETESFDLPLAKDLRSVTQVNSLTGLWDSLRNHYVLSGSFGGNYRAYQFDALTERWAGVMTYTDSSYMFTHIAAAGNYRDTALTTMNSKAPFQRQYVALNNGTYGRLMMVDPTLYADETASGVSAAFTCALETANHSEPLPVEKQCLGVYVECKGTWTVKLLHRADPYADFTSVTLGTVTDGGWVSPSTTNMPVYRERKIRLEATSASNLRIRKVYIKEVSRGARRG